tara:strand:- start:577 stop:2355 length:1779 start_codon:yes stop_codon:yes gene_type:complete
MLMRRWRSTFLILLSLLIAGSLLYCFDQDSAVQVIGKKRILIGNEKDLSSVVISISTNQLVLRRSDTVDDWLIGKVENQLEPADPRSVLSFLSELSLIQLEYGFSLEEMQDRGFTLSDYGLDVSSDFIKIKRAGQEREWMLGSESSLGSVRYLMLRDSDEIYLMDKTSESVLPNSVDDLYDYRLFVEYILQSDRIEISGSASDGFIQMIRSDDEGWKLFHPRSGSVDQVAVLRLLEKLNETRMTSFIEGDASEKSVFGFDEPFMRLVLSSVQGGAVSFYVGDKVIGREGIRYASRGDEKVGLVYESLVQELLVAFAQFRAEQVFDFMGESSNYLRLSDAGRKVGFVSGSNEVWRMNQPFDWAVDERIMAQIKGFIEGMVVTRFGVTPNTESRPLVIEAGSQKGSKNQKVTCFLPSDPDAPVQVQFHGDKKHHEVNLVRPLFDLLNPLSYKDRRIFSFDSVLVRIEQVLKEEEKQSIIWDPEAAVWNLSDSNVSTDKLNIWVEQLQQMEAESFVASYPSSLAPFGLENPICRLIFYERDSRWHSLEMMVGNRSDEGGYYAMFKGRDIVFRLSTESVQLCMKNLRKSELISDGE